MEVKDIDKIVIKDKTIEFIDKHGNKERHRKTVDWLRMVIFLNASGSVKSNQIVMK